MKFNGPPKFYRGATFDKYLGSDLFSWMTNIFTGLSKLTFQENFQSFTVTKTIPALTEVAIPNGFLNQAPGAIPTQRIITRQTVANTVVDGPTAWNANFVYLYNYGPLDVVVTVTFFR
jgi:hypothetical protein